MQQNYAKACQMSIHSGYNPTPSSNQSLNSFSFAGMSKGQNFHVKIDKAYGILGFVRFLKGYYLLMITKRVKVAKIGYHSIYQIKDMKMIPLFKCRSKQENEMRYVELFKQMKINDGFYFSYTYDLTHTLQYNILKNVKNEEKNKFAGSSAEDDGVPSVVFDDMEQERAQSDEDVIDKLDNGPDMEDIFHIETDGQIESHSIKQQIFESKHHKNKFGDSIGFGKASIMKSLQYHGFSEKILMEHQPFESHFLWNHHLIKEFYRCLVKKKWVMPVIYGNISQFNFRGGTKNCTFLLISRRSRRFAGTRYLKRGINEHGNVANFVEVE